MTGGSGTPPSEETKMQEKRCPCGRMAETDCLGECGFPDAERGIETRRVLIIPGASVDLRDLMQLATDRDLEPLKREPSGGREFYGDDVRYRSWPSIEGEE
jgi:hypothetical protein